MFYNKGMENLIESFYKYNITYISNYLKNNPCIDENNYTIEELIDCLDLDMSIVLHTLKISVNKLGYEYWKCAITLFFLKNSQKVNMNNDIYAHIAKKYDKTLGSIERSMRVCFENSLYNVSRDKNLIIDFIAEDLIKPRNGELIYKLSELISSRQFQKNKFRIHKFYNQ